jgi:16S rRNA (guanine966-N2)-methyltransferase
VREALFSTVAAVLGDLAGARVADLFAGSGAVGLEALSRGAAHALLVESDPGALRTLRGNVAALGLVGAEVRGAPVARVLAAGPGEPYDLVFLDPPYALAATELSGLLQAVAGGWLREGGVVVVERAARGPAVRWPPGLTADRERRYGETALWYGRDAR